MEQEYSKDFFWDTYKKLPEDLKEALFSDKNNQVVEHICAQSGLDEEQTAGIAKFIGRVLMGLLPLSEFPVIIELELNIKQDLASQINRQIYISIFKHLRVSLNKINDANFGYVDSFTSENDGKEEEKKREEASKPNPVIQQPPLKTNPIAEFSKPPVFPNEIKTDAPEKIENPQIVPVNKEPPFSYTETPKPQPLTPTPAPEKIATEEEIKKPLPNTLSRNAFEKELQKENAAFPEIPVSLGGSIPTIAIDGMEEVKKEAIPEEKSFSNNNVPVSPPVTAPNISEISEKPKEVIDNPPKMPISNENIEPVDMSQIAVPKNPFPEDSTNEQQKDPYKEMPI
ncbi:MAG: hypothetical protein PHR47_03450 [Candidatus Pacebacteria bacterium]|nr:hypothetical protein [Candidatus Paceibacterota bacterium]